MLDIKELEKEFEQEFGKIAVEEEPEVQVKSKQDKILEEAVKDMIGAYMEECVSHFLGNRSRKMEDDARYFYNNGELDVFKQLYTDKGGDLELLHIGNVYYDDGEWLCYEVCRKKYYNMETDHARKKGASRIFFS